MLEYWQMVGMEGKDIALLLVDRLDDMMNAARSHLRKDKNPSRRDKDQSRKDKDQSKQDRDQSKKALDYIDYILPFLDRGCYFKGREIILYKEQNIVVRFMIEADDNVVSGDNVVFFYFSAKNIDENFLTVIISQRESGSLSAEEREEKLDRIHYDLACLYSTMAEQETSRSLHERLLIKRLKNPYVQLL